MHAPHNPFPIFGISQVIISLVILTSGRATETLDFDAGVLSVTRPTRVSTRTVKKPSDAFNIEDTLVFNASTTSSSLNTSLLL
ncbi:hypothetical protein CVT25_000727 [Psilocybe cyanescens]|uniref:Uncharacterized protein n=1 Tax=Psilocybe cyanescens TaxID=93625 RepID=A0A409X3K7_PSICY|nr:hypothetical protein CVT25_000727 [Psilocybe cyanescens]